MENNSLEQILGKFENGEQRYETDPHFQEAADALKAGLGVYAVLDKVLKQNTFMRASMLAMSNTNIDLRAENDVLELALSSTREVARAALSKTDTSPKLKKIVYLTGPQGSGKSTLVSLTQNAAEVAVSPRAQWGCLSDTAENYKDKEVLFLTGLVRHEDLSRKIKNFCTYKGLEFEEMKTEPLSPVKTD